MVIFSPQVFGNLRHVLLESGVEVEYVIDGRNRRVGKKVNGQLVQGFLYDHQLRIVAELDGSQQVVARFIYADGINVPELMEKNGRTYRLLHDHLGSPRLVVDIATGEIAQELAYDAWGTITFDSNPGFQPFGFAGGLHDPHTRLIRFGARDYDPQLGRWTAKDPIGFAGGDANLFSYVRGAVTFSVDPEGLGYIPNWFAFENRTTCPLLTFGERGPLSPGTPIMVPPGRVSLLGFPLIPGRAPFFADIDFVCIDGTWYKTKFGGAVVEGKSISMFGGVRRANEQESRTLPPCLPLPCGEPR